MTLDELSVGHSGVITAVGGEGILRCRLLDMELFLRGYTLTLRKEDARSITIEEDAE